MQHPKTGFSTSYFDDNNNGLSNDNVIFIGREGVMRFTVATSQTKLDSLAV